MRLKKYLQNTLMATVLSAGAVIQMNEMAMADVIALSLPMSGDFAEIGRNYSLGAKLAMEQLGKDHELFIADDGCDANLASLASDDIISWKASIVTGMICNEAALQYASELQKSGIPLLIAGARSVRLIKDKDREDWNLWRMSPGDDAAADAIASYITQNLKDTAFALIDDGTIYGRNTTDAIRLQLNEAGMKPQFSDNFRAAQSTQSGMLRRLQRSGVSIGFITSATQEDLFTIAKDHTALNLKNKLILSEQLAILPYLENAQAVNDGIIVIMPPAPVDLQTTAAVTELLKARDIKPSKSIYDGYAAIQVAIAALGETRKETTNNLATKRFESITGPVEFDKSGKNLHNPYKLHVWRDGALKPLDDANGL